MFRKCLCGIFMVITAVGFTICTVSIEGTLCLEIYLVNLTSYQTHFLVISILIWHILFFLLTYLFTYQTPKVLHAVQPPSDISSFLFSLWYISIHPKVSLPGKPQIKLVILIDGNDYSQAAAMKMNGWKDMKQINVLPSSQNLRQLLAEMNSLPQENCN